MESLFALKELLLESTERRLVFKEPLPVSNERLLETKHRLPGLAQLLSRCFG